MAVSVFFFNIIFVGQAFFSDTGFLGQRVVGSCRCFWDVESVSWTGYSMGFTDS